MKKGKKLVKKVVQYGKQEQADVRKVLTKEQGKKCSEPEQASREG